MSDGIAAVSRLLPSAPSEPDHQHLQPGPLRVRSTFLHDRRPATLNLDASVVYAAQYFPRHTSFPIYRFSDKSVRPSCHPAAGLSFDTLPRPQLVWATYT